MQHVSKSRPLEHRTPAERGFTLVELMVVVAIIALLASIVIPNFVHARAQAAVSQTQANMKQVGTALELYYADKQDYPTAGGNITPLTFGAATNPYLSVTPVNSLKRIPYVYTYVPANGGVPPSYTINDPGDYDPTTLSNLTNGPGGSTTCGTTCRRVWYDPKNGFYGQ